MAPKTKARGQTFKVKTRNLKATLCPCLVEKLGAKSCLRFVSICHDIIILFMWVILLYKSTKHPKDFQGEGRLLSVILIASPDRKKEIERLERVTCLHSDTNLLFANAKCTSTNVCYLETFHCRHSVTAVTVCERVVIK